MKRYSLVSLLVVVCFVVAGSALAFDKEAYYEAEAAYEAGVKISDSQIELMRSVGYDFTFRPSENELDRTGGPDLWGYSYIDNEEVEGPDWAWVDITATGMLVEGLADDNYVGPYAMGIDFPFYSGIYNEIYIQSNGVLSFFDAYVSLSNYEMPYAGFVPYEAMIAWFWDDLNANNGGEVYIEAVDMGDQMACVIQYVEYHDYWPNTGYCDFEIIMYEDGSILMMYDYISDDMNVDSCTNGIQNEAADIGLTYVYNNDPVGYPYTGLAVLYYPGDAPEPDADVEGYVTDADTGDPIEGASVTVGGLNTTTDALGYYSITGMFPGDYPVLITMQDYFDHNGMVTLVSGMNTYDAMLVYNDPNADILVWLGDTTPESCDPVIAVLNDLGYSTFSITDYAAVDWTNYEYVFAFLGIYPNYYPVLTGTDEETVMVDYLNAGGNLYVEGGDIFGYNSPENLLLALNIDDAADGSGDLGFVTGVVGTYTEGWYMEYAGENSWIDRLTPGVGAVTILTNEDVVTPYNCGMLNDAGDYRNACFSFEVGMLVDGNEGTVGDMIAGVMDFFNPAGDMFILTATPVVDPTIIDPPGAFQWDAYVENISGGVVTFDAWTALTLPIGVEYGPLNLFTGLTLPDGAALAVTPTQVVPGIAAMFPGTYTYHARVGDFLGGVVYAEDTFPFDVVPTGPMVTGTFDTDEWVLLDFIEIDELNAPEVSNNVPSQYALNEAYPNPFNPTTTISISLPEVSHLQVNVFNALGQQVSVIANGYVEAGYHNFTFDANGLASGIYFVQAVVPGKMNDMRKVVLMR